MDTLAGSGGSLGTMLAPACLALGLLLQSPPREEVVTRVHDIRLLQQAHLSNDHFVPHGFHLSDAHEGDNPQQPPSFPFPPPLLRRTDSWGLAIYRFQGGLSNGLDFEVLAESEGSLTVRGPIEAQERIDDLLQCLEEASLRTVQVKAYRLEPSEVSPDSPAVLRAPEVEALLRKARPTDSERANVRLNRRGRLGSIDQAAKLLGHFVMAQSKLIAPEPWVFVLTEGLEVAVEVRPTLGEEYELRVYGRRGSERDVAGISRTPIVPGSSAVTQLARIRSESFSGSAFLQDGGGLLIGSDLPGSGMYLIRIDRSSEERTQTMPRPTGVLISAPMTYYAQPPLCFGETPWSNGRRNSNWQRDWDFIRQAPWELEDLDGALEELLSTGKVDLWTNACEWWGEEALFRGDLPQAGSAIAFLQREAETYERDIEVELRIGPVEDFSGPESTDLQSLANELPHRILGVTRLGGTTTLTSVLESLRPLPARLEVRKESRFFHPEVTIDHQGFALTFCAASLEENYLQAHFEWTDQRIERTVDKPLRANRASLTKSLRAPLGHWCLAGVITTANPAHTTVILLRVR